MTRVTVVLTNWFQMDVILLGSRPHPQCFILAGERPMDARFMGIAYLTVAFCALSTAALNARMNLIQVVSRSVPAMACRTTELAVYGGSEILLDEVVEKLRASRRDRASPCLCLDHRLLASPKK
ncbi:MAG: hypothetical protein HQ559_05735 [Lentisphaerae bacterium]|nr:hypothetical protein [Lentisphaerota bacterium]